MDNNHEKTKLNDEVLDKVSGGFGDNNFFDNKRREFDEACHNLGMDVKGYAGMMRAEFFDEWEMGGYRMSAYEFLLTKS